MDTFWGTIRTINPLVVCFILWLCRFHCRLALQHCLFIIQQRVPDSSCVNRRSITGKGAQMARSSQINKSYAQLVERASASAARGHCPCKLDVGTHESRELSLHHNRFTPTGSQRALLNYQASRDLCHLLHVFETAVWCECLGLFHPCLSPHNLIVILWDAGPTVLNMCSQKFNNPPIPFCHLCNVQIDVGHM